MEFAARYDPWAVVAGAPDVSGATVARLLGTRRGNGVLVARRPVALGEVAATASTEPAAVVLGPGTAGAEDALAVEVVTQGAAGGESGPAE